MKLYNSLTKSETELNKKTIKIYLCGPTVQDSPHIGHMRGAVVFDVLTRWLKYQNRNVILCRNITDIDDKILKKANEINTDWKKLGEKYTNEFHNSFDNLSILKPEFEPKATENIDEIIAFIQKLVEKGYAYSPSKGNVYFDTSKYTAYGELTHQKPENTEIDEDEKYLSEKKSPYDFALLKSAKNTEPEDANWDTPFGRGRPGWHIECSAMAHKYLGETFDIHGGGLDLRFPHHENELAQSKAVGYDFASIWMHHGWVTKNNEKMSKSLGTGLKVSNFSNYPALRWALLQAHYRANLDFSNEIYDSAKKAIERFVKIFDNVEMAKTVSDDFKTSIENDLNIPMAIAAIYNNIKNNVYDVALKELEILGIDFSKLSNSKKEHILSDEIKKLIKKRDDAKKNKQYEVADKIRDDLSKKGIEIIDTADGTKVNFINEQK